MRPEKQGASQVASTQGLVPISDEDSKGPVVLTLVEPTQGHDLDKQSVWNVRLKNGELSLSKGEVKVKDLPLAAWYTAAQDLVEADRMAVYDAKRIAYLNEIDFW